MTMHSTIGYRHLGLNLTDIVKIGVGGEASVYINTKDYRYKSLKMIPDNNNIKHFVGCFFPTLPRHDSHNYIILYMFYVHALRFV